MDRYQKVEKPRAEQPINENEIRITSQGRMRSYITYAMTLLQEKGSSEIVFKAMGRAINKTVTIVELIKRRIVGLHQNTSIGSTDITDTWEPLEEGLLPLETTRHVSMITITLSKEELDTSSIGYQPPLPADQVKVSTDFEYDGEGSPTARGRGRGGRGRGRGRSSRPAPGNGYAQDEYEDGGWDGPGGYPRGRGRGRGRSFRGRGRGNYNNAPYMDAQQDTGGYNQESPRGRGRNFRGRGRGGYNNGSYMDNQQDVGGYNQESPRGRGRNFRGRGRGGYNNEPYMDTQQDAGGYNQEFQGRGRGRGRGTRGRGRGFRSNRPNQAAEGETQTTKISLVHFWFSLVKMNHEDVDILIVGAGLAGLTTALSLHRLGLRSLVLESSESLRITGFSLSLWPNAWRALDVVGIGNTMRQTSTLIKGFKIASLDTGLITSEQAIDKDGKFKGYESRSVMRSDLLEIIVNELPQGTIRYSSKVVAIDELGPFKLVHLADGFVLKTKVLIGCDGVKSVVAKWLGLQTPISVGRSVIRGLAEFPGGSSFDPMFHLNFGGGVRFGFLPVEDKTMYWFCTFPPSQVPTYEKDWKVNPIKMKQFVLNRINKMPQEAQDVVKRTTLSNISCAKLKIRLPWNVLFGNIVKDNVCVAGDALHPMTPDIGQGGCAALEDAVVLGRCLGEAFLKKQSEYDDDEFERIKKGLQKYGKERRWRSFSLISASYCVGFMQESKWTLMSFLRKVWFSSYTSTAFLKMTTFDCGNLVC
ncbi:hypothetical protein M8C21_009638 [Ambrosia artemisiifolia]|uniref:FAD-binding domain-containing protein n=1 Tax=Ambrosia artemisiifolia TaxID=4212 RepID=A0AAD5DEK5_AMBAR|nr:hypothetical protein M8C21_009638 [Ambrosia artemisiifolia]